jgi:alanine racemase
MSFIHLNRRNFFYNLKQIEKRVISKDQIAVVLKDNAYGHGLKEMAQLSFEYGIQRVVVKNCEEAFKIINFFEHILILFYDFNFIKNNKQKCSNKKLTFSVHSMNEITKFKNLDSEFNIALKTDSGMHRSGVDFVNLEASLKSIILSENLKLTEVFTHFREADELSSALFWQKENFKKIKHKTILLTDEYKIKEPIFHSNNSAGLFRNNLNNPVRDEVVRTGIAIYGYLNDTKNKIFNFPELKPVLSLWANRIGESRLLKKGSRIGYGGISPLSKRQFISIFDFGYADGFRRFPDSFYKKNIFTTPENIKLNGRISMDSSAFETDKDKILIFNNVSEIAKIFNTIEYEILVSLNHNIQKIII